MKYYALNTIFFSYIYIHTNIFVWRHAHCSKGFPIHTGGCHVPALPPLVTASLSSSFLKDAQHRSARLRRDCPAVAAQSIKCSKADSWKPNVWWYAIDDMHGPEKENCLTPKLHNLDKLDGLPHFSVAPTPWRSPQCAQPVGMPLAIPRAEQMTIAAHAQKETVQM